MIVVIVVGIFAVLFAYLSKFRNYSNGLKWSFGFIFIFLAARYDFGNDYMSYLHFFKAVNESSSADMDLFLIKGNEYGWLYINRLFAPLGFFAMTAVLAFFNCFVLFKFIKKYVSVSYYWVAVFIYIFQPYNMLVLSSAMRQAVAFSFFLLAIDFIVQKKVIKFLLLISMATFFHASAFFLFPVILLGFINWQIKLKHMALIVIMFIMPIIFVKELFDGIEHIISEYFKFYSSYVKDANLDTVVGAGFGLNVFIYLIVIYYSQFETVNDKSILFKISIISFLMIPFSFGVPLLSRLNFYFAPVLMAVFPYVFEKMKKIGIRIPYILVVVFFTLYNFYVFFRSDVWKDHFTEYHTIFSASVMF